MEFFLKTINLNAKSWHYFLAVTIGGFQSDSGDFCSYVRWVIAGAIALAFITTAVGIMAGIALLGAFGIGYALVHLLFGIAMFNNPIILICSIITSVVITFFALMLIVGYLKDKWNNREQVEKPDSFVKSAYKSFKDKVCFKVDFNNGD
jgi:hypothetical protein